MTTTTETREPEMGLTFEKVWAMFQESDLRMRRLSEETDRKMQETDRKMQETDRKMQETDRKIREMNEETARQIKETNRQIGGLGNRFGELAEHLVAPNIVQKFNDLGFHFDDISAGLRQVIEDESSGQKIAEFDILLENGESVIGVEVKSKPSCDDVEDHLQRLRILRINKDRKNDKRKIYGALAGAIMPSTVKTAALKAGIYVITQTGDTVKIDVPEDFIPRAWYPRP
ncbi:MAG: hypothetical protein LBG12_00670 [Synergistaceae bacterium]|jgi:hypothetical protein|nr:hypothetical protein [Synergistaceae bacterium]